MTVKDTPGSKECFEAIDIKKDYSGVPVLLGVSITLKPGEVVGLVGHNGAGKSTLLRVLSGAHQQSAGTIRIDGEEVEFGSPNDAIQRGVSTVYQELSLLPGLTVAQNIWLGRELKKSKFVLDHASMRKGAQQLLADFDLPIDIDRKVGSYPVATRQLLEIAIASSRKTRYLLLDEPTTALEGDQVSSLLSYIRKLADERHIGVLIINHKLDELYGVADRITALMNGRVLLDAPAASVDRKAVVAAIAGADYAEIDVNREAIVSDHETVMRVENLESSVLNGVSFEVRSAEILGIYGLGGSGRSETLRAIAGIAPARSGRVRIKDQPSFLPRTPSESIRHGIAFLTEERKSDGMVPQMSAYLNTSLPVLERFSRASRLNFQEMFEASDVILRPLKLKGDPNGSMTALSGGNQQKVLIARTLMQNPDVMLLDEPSKGVDIGAKSEIHALLRKLAHVDGKAIVMVTSEEEEILDVADRVLVFSGGRVVAGPIGVSELDVPTLRTLAWRETAGDSTAGSPSDVKSASGPTD